MSKNTKQKYYNFMLELYNQKEFDIKEMMREHRIGSRVITLMRESNMIKRQGRHTKWIAEMPTQAVANAFAKECLKQSRIANAQSKAGEQQMIITPIRKAPAPAPIPVMHEPDCDNSNSKMLLIMAVGLVIGFLIATAIWK
jgi:hypothetical protein